MGCACTRSGSGRRTAAQLDAACRQQFIGREPAGAGGFGFGGGGFGGGGGGGFRRGIDEDTLKAVASLTGGEYYPAESAERARAGLPRPADHDHHQVRAGRGQRRVRWPGRRARRDGPAPRPRLAPAAVALRPGRSPRPRAAVPVPLWRAQRSELCRSCHRGAHDRGETARSRRFGASQWHEDAPFIAVPLGEAPSEPGLPAASAAITGSERFWVEGAD